MNRRAIIGSGLAAAASCILPARAAEATRILLLDSNIINYLPAYVAIDQGFFAAHGLAVERQTIPNASYTTAALFSGNAQVGTLSPFPLLQAAAAGLDVVVLATSDVLPSPIRNGVVVSQASPIHTAQDLVGRRVGVAGINGALHILTRQWLHDAGVDYDKVSFVEVSFAQMPDALRSGQVDAVATVDPFLGRVVESGAGRSIVDLSAGAPPGTAGSFYAAERGWAASNRDAVAGFRAGLADAVAFIGREPARARDILAAYTKLPPQVTASSPMPDFRPKPTQAQVDYYAGIARGQKLIDADAKVDGIVLP